MKQALSLVILAWWRSAFTTMPSWIGGAMMWPRTSAAPKERLEDGFGEFIETVEGFVTTERALGETSQTDEEGSGKGKDESDSSEWSS